MMKMNETRIIMNELSFLDKKDALPKPYYAFRQLLRMIFFVLLGPVIQRVALFIG